MCRITSKFLRMTRSDLSVWRTSNPSVEKLRIWTHENSVHHKKLSILLKTDAFCCLSSLTSCCCCCVFLSTETLSGLFSQISCYFCDYERFVVIKTSQSLSLQLSANTSSCFISLQTKQTFFGKVDPISASSGLSQYMFIYFLLSLIFCPVSEHFQKTDCN